MKAELWDYMSQIKPDELIPQSIFPSWDGSYELYKVFFQMCMDGGFADNNELNKSYNQLLAKMYSNSGGNSPDVEEVISRQLRPLYESMQNLLNPNNEVMDQEAAWNLTEA